MSFYGKVINYLAKAFASIKVGNTSISASNIDDTLELKGDNYIILQPDVTNKKITISHAAANGSATQTTSFKIDKEDISDGATLTGTAVEFDSKGHQLSCNDIKIGLNINGEKTRAQNAESQLQTNIKNETTRATKQEGILASDIQAEEKRAQGAEKSLSERIGYAETTDEDGQVVPPSGVYVELKAESNRAKNEEQILKQAVADLKDEDLEIYKTITETAAQVKADILGDASLLKTYDTLLEIEQWIEGPGVNATELTAAIADEAELRKKEDDALSKSIQQNRDDIDILNGDDSKAGSVLNTISPLKDTNNKQQASLNKIEGEATVENSMKWHVAQEAKLRAEEDSKLSVRIDGHQTRLNTIENSITTLNSDETTIGSVSNTVSKALNKYETTEDAAQKLTDAKAYTDSSIAALDVLSPCGEGYYVANISQVDGKIIPEWIPFPLDLTSIAARYDEETGNLTLPINTIIVAVIENGG